MKKQVTVQLTEFWVPVALRLNGGLRRMQAPDVPGQFQRRMAALVVAMANPRGRVHLAAENGSGGTLRGLPELARSGWTCPGTGTAITGPRDSL